MKNFISKLPKAELHLHIEGSLEPELMFALAQRNQIQIPYKTIEEVKEAYRFSCLQDFLNIYYAGASVLIEEEDFYDLTLAYLTKCHEESILHTEIMFDPQTHTQRGIAFSTVINGIQRAREEAEQRWGISSLLIMSYLRHLSEEEAFETLQQSLPYKHLIKAVGLDSSENGNPPSKFYKVFEASAQEGYVLLAHAGEEGPAAYVWEAIDGLKIARIDHGNNSLTDDTLVDEIIKRDMALTVCPLSNLELKVVNDLKEHPLKTMINKGIKATVNSDDPAYFGGYLNQNFIKIQEALSLSKDDIVYLANNSIQYSLADENRKQELLQLVADYVLNN